MTRRIIPAPLVWLDSGDYNGIDTYLYLFLFENNKGIIADYADFLRTFFVKDFPQAAFKQVPALIILSAWYYYLTSRHREFEEHMDAVYKALPGSPWEIPNLWNMRFWPTASITAPAC